MRSQTPFLFGQVVFCVALLLMITGPARAEDVKESFANISEGALLTTIPKWSHATGNTDNWVLTNFGTSDGNGFEAGATGAYHRTLSDSEAVTGSSPHSFKTTIRFTGSTAWASVHIDLLESGGINGCGIRFDGGPSDGSTDTVIGISNGGTYWGDVKYDNLKTHWQANVWYVIEINGLSLGGGGLKATVTIYDKSNPSNKLADNSPIAIYGNPMTFDKIDTISISSVGAERAFQIGEIDLGKSSDVSK